MALYMVIEHCKDFETVGARFRERGRMLPDGVAYHASWIDEPGGRCFQIMEAARAELLDEWTARWTDLVRFEIVPVRTSIEFWAGRAH